MTWLAARASLRSIGGAAATALGLVLSACSAELTGGLVATGSQGTSGVSSDVPGTYGSAIGSSEAKKRFDPFAPDGAIDTPRREVIANPSLAEILKPGPIPEFSLGRADAPVVMVKYMSLTCPYCRRFMAETFPVLKRQYIDTGKVRLVIREFPIGKSSGNATIALRCAPMDKYLTLYQKYLEQQPRWVSQEVRLDAIYSVAAQVGMKRPEFDACMKNQSMIEGLKQVKDRGRQLGIIGTPNFFIGNRLVKTVIGIEEIRAIVDPMLAGKASVVGAARPRSG